jgi:hypothetical protein
LASNNETNEAEISLLFEDAKVKLDKIDAQKQKEKKQIIIQLAKDLEGKIPTDIISIEIVNQLRGKVSERFIHNCLEEKYKQKRRVENARKQKKQESVEEENLAVISPLNQEAKNKEIMVDVDGRSVEEDLETSPTIDDSTTDSTFAKASSHEQGLTKQLNHDLKECSSCGKLYSENLELKEALEKATRSITADNMISASSLSTSQPTSCTDNNHAVDDILEFEFPLLVEDVRKYIVAINSKTTDGRNAWFSGRIDKKTGRVVSARTGKIGRPQSDFGDSHSRGGDV